LLLRESVLPLFQDLLCDPGHIAYRAKVAKPLSGPALRF
jgi:hypothetical protein